MNCCPPCATESTRCWPAEPQQAAGADATAPGPPLPVIFTIGHSTRPLADVVALLQAHRVTLLVDVRSVPRSRHNPQFNADSLSQAIESLGLQYVHAAGLGGFRPTGPGSVNGGWRNASFRGYADYMQTPDFAENLFWLMRLGEAQAVAVMCAEAVPWRCHRSLIADALSVQGWVVNEIVSPTRVQPHKLTPFAQVVGNRITYPPPTPPSSDGGLAGPLDAAG